MERQDTISNRTDETVDAFHRGDFYLVQPKGRGHRSGLDAMLLASLVPDAAKGRLADLGAGAGAAGFAVASRLSALEVTLVERAPEMVEFARRSIALPQNAHLAPRLHLTSADIASSAADRKAAGLADNSFQHVVMNPPFNDARSNTTPDPLRAQAHAAHQGLFEDWIKCAAAICAASGQLALIARPQSLQEILHACQNRFGGLEVTPVHPKSNEPALRILVTGVKGSRASLCLRSQVTIHKDGSRDFSSQVDALTNGTQSYPRLAG